MLNNSLALKTTHDLTRKKVVFSLLKYSLLLLVFYFFSSASVNLGVHTTFAFGVYFALIAFGFNIFLTSGVYLAAYMLANFSLPSLYYALAVVGFALVVYLIFYKLKKQIPLYALLVAGVFSGGVYVFLQSATSAQVLASVLSIFLGLLLLVAAYIFLRAFSRSAKLSLTVDEVISGSLLLMVFAAGLSSVNFHGVEFVKIFAVFFILISTYLFPTFHSIFIGLIMGLGATIYSGNLSFAAAFSIFALLATAFKSNNKLFSCLAILLAEIIFGLALRVYEVFGVYSILSVLMGEIMFLLLPQSALSLLAQMFGLSDTKFAQRNLINHSKQQLCQRMTDIAGVFSEMDRVFRSMVRGTMPPDDAKKMLVAEVVEKITLGSPELAKVLRNDAAATVEVLGDLVDIGFQKGRVTLLDIPQYITSKIGKVNFLINTINQLLSSYKQYSVMIGNMDTSRTLIADQLSGISNILRSLAQEVNLNITFDQAKEKRIMEELNYKSILCLEVVVYEQNSHVVNVTLLVSESTFNAAVIEKVASKIVLSRLKVVSSALSGVSGYLLVMLATSPNHDLVFGSASSGKTGEVVNGDTHSFIRIDDGKYMIALCDGMGSGKRANAISNLSISLIENFYKAGFDNEIILNSVNKLLSQNSEEAFTALDICVVDTRRGICDFIKLGSPQGYIKHKNTTEVIEASGLPMGVLEEMRPHITKKVLTDHDIIVLVSDGVTDAFGLAGASLEEFVNGLETTNPQTIADEIMDRAVDLQNGVCADDMTALAVRVFPVV